MVRWMLVNRICVPVLMFTCTDLVTIIIKYKLAYTINVDLCWTNHNEGCTLFSSERAYAFAFYIFQSLFSQQN